MIRIKKQSNISKARIGEIQVAHGALETPFFMPDATRAVLKGLSNDDIKNLGLPAMVVNTFHLYLQPGNKRIKQIGGVHDFMNIKIPLVSDSGGFQVFSLVHRGANMGSITDKGVKFKSPLNGAWHWLDAKKSIQIQLDLGTDIVVCLDDCPPNDASSETIDKAIERTIDWAKKSKEIFEKEIEKRGIRKNKKPLLMAVIQGGENIKKRQYCASELKKIGFAGFGYGARPVDKDGNFLDKVLEATADACPADTFRFALGIGTPEDIVRCARMGYDIFDCVIPTREGRHGRLFYFLHDKLLTKKDHVAKFYKTINILNAKFTKDNSPINKDSQLSELKRYSKAYLHHLFKIKDPLGARLASLQNLEFYKQLMDRIRKNINENKM